MTRMTAIAACVLLLLAATGARAQVAQWNHFVQDEALEAAFHGALNRVVTDYIQAAQEEGRPAAVLFVDSQMNVSLLMTSSTFRPFAIDASRAKAEFVIDYQALSSKGAKIQVGTADFDIGGGR